MSTDQSKNPFWGRRYRLLIEMKGKQQGTVIEVANSAFEPEALRISFRVDQPFLQAFPWAEIVVYNLNGETEQKIIESGYTVNVKSTEVKEGAHVILEAGYHNGLYGKIFDGYVIQSFRERENVTDFKLTLNCTNQAAILQNNLVSFTLNAGTDTRTRIKAISKMARTPIELGGVTDDLDPSTLPRGKVYFGEPKKYFRQIAQHNRAQWFVHDNKVHIGKLTDVPRGKALVLTPSTGLVGTPQQTNDGVAFRCLLDPRIKVVPPPDSVMVKLDMVTIRQMKIRPPQTPISPLDQDGIYQIAGVSYTGDTRGNAWYTDCIGINQAGKVDPRLALPTMMQNAKQDPN